MFFCFSRPVAREPNRCQILDRAVNGGSAQAGLNSILCKHGDADHNNIPQRSIGIRPDAGDTPESFVRRRGRIVAQERQRGSLAVSQEWSLSLVRWLEHVGRHPALPASIMLTIQGD